MHGIHNMKINTCFIIVNTNLKFAFTAKQGGLMYVFSSNIFLFENIEFRQ